MLNEKEIQTLCKKVIRTFSQTLKRNKLSCALALGNLFICLQNEQLKEEVDHALNVVKNVVSPSDIHDFLQQVQHLPKKLLDPGNEQSIAALKSGLLRDEYFLRNIDISDIFNFYQDEHWYRECLIAIIRKHLINHKRPDPFVIEYFNFDLLFQGGVDNNFIYLALFLDQCEELPIEQIVQLGMQNEKIATLILQDFSLTQWYLQLSGSFLDTFPQLSTFVARSWQVHFDTYSLSAIQQNYVQQSLPLLQKQYTEFKDVSLQRRVSRNLHTTTLDLSRYSYDAMYLSLTIAGLAILGPQLVAGLGQFCTLLQGCCFVKPLVLPVYAGLTWHFEALLRSRAAKIEIPSLKSKDPQFYYRL